MNHSRALVLHLVTGLALVATTRATPLRQATPTTALGPVVGGSSGSGGSSQLLPTPSGQDDCANASQITGLGYFDVNTVFKSTSPQQSGVCPTAHHDVWFGWTAPSTGIASLRLCAVPGNSVIAVYDGAGCPTGTNLIACNDDFCAEDAGLDFSVIAGQVYTLQMGSIAVDGIYGGQFTLDMPFGCAYDDGTTTAPYGLSTFGSLIWMNRFGSASTTSTVASVSTAYGCGGFVNNINNGRPTTIGIWDDPNDDGVPDDLVLVATRPSTVTFVDTNVLNVTAFTPPVVVTGVYFVGVYVVVNQNEPVAPLDSPVAPAGRSYWVGNGGPMNLSNLGAAQTPPTPLEAFGIMGVWRLRADCTSTPTTGSAFCGGTAALCPCVNVGSPGHGCGNSVIDTGALLVASGSSILAADTLVLSATGMPNGSGTNACTFAQGTAQASALFGDGLRCIGGGTIRLGTRIIASGGARFGHAIGVDPDISIQGAVLAAGTRTYQTIYRNADAFFCTPATFNGTNGVEVLWN